MTQLFKLAKTFLSSTKSPRSKEKPIENVYDNWEPNTQEKELIKLTWSNDFDFLFTLGANIYVYIFENNPKAKGLFPSIHKHGDDWQNSKEFRRIALVLAQSVDFAIKNIYHMDEVADYFYRLGARHVKHVERGFKPEYWTVFPDSIVSSLEPKLTSFSEAQRAETIRVWRRLALYITNHMRRGFFSTTDPNKDRDVLL